MLIEKLKFCSRGSERDDLKINFSFLLIVNIKRKIIKWQTTQDGISRLGVSFERRSLERGIRR